MPGQATGKYYSHYGSGTNILCMNTTESDAYTRHSVSSYPGLISGLEYYHTSTQSGHIIPCAICVSHHKSTLMIPNKSTCPDGWTQEYHGALASAPDYSSSYFASEYICLDDSMESFASGSGADTYLTYVQYQCGNLKCNGVSNGNIPACSVCSK